MYPESEIRDRAKRLYEFVRGLIMLRQVPVRTLASYELVVPLDDLPTKPQVLFVARGDFEGADEEAWFEVRCPRIVNYPEPPPILRDWLDPSQLGDAAIELPELLAGLRYPGCCAEGGDEDVFGGQGAPPDDAAEPPAEVRDAWERYVDEEWWPWAERTRPTFRAKKLYDDLFRMYQRQEHLGETYEVVLGLGLLAWRPSNEAEVFRHLVTTPLSLMLDAKRQVLSLLPPASGIELHLEDDMIDPALRPAIEIRNRIKEGLSELDASLWQGEHLHNLLRDYCNALEAEAWYETGTTPPKAAGPSPIVTFAPTIILRRRGAEGLIGFVDQIIRAIEEGADIPPAVRQQVCVEEAASADGEATVVLDTDDEVYFPLPANREQIRIVERLKKASGIVVEGPPGTGKSQTIANLVCHLLATGSRVLVTSHTARALQVLRDKIPEEIRPLCVQALSNDRKGMDALEFSVRGITDRHLTWNGDDAEASAGASRAELGRAREQLQKAIYDQRSVREAEVFEHTGVAGRYAGTLAQIARQIQTEQEELGFIVDDVPLDTDVPCSAESFRMTQVLLAADPAALALGEEPEPPTPAHLPDPDQFRDLVEAVEALEGAVADQASATHSQLAARLGSLTSEVRDALGRAIDQVAIPLRALSKERAEPWLESAAEDVFSGRERRWRELHALTVRRVSTLKAVREQAIEARISGHEGHDVDTLKHYAGVLCRRLRERNGKGYGISLLQPPPVRVALASLDTVRVNGGPATDAEALDLLSQWAEVAIQLRALDEEWTEIADLPRGTFSARITQYEDNCGPLAALIQIAGRAAEASREFARYGIAAPRWHDVGDTEEYRRALALARLTTELEEANRAYREATEPVLSGAGWMGASATRVALETAVRAQDVAAYRTLYADIASAHRVWERAQAVATTLILLREAIPRLTDALGSNPGDPRWERLAARWEDAWAWAAARTWLTALADPEADRKAAQRVFDEQRRIRDLLATLAAEQAWAHCFRPDRLTEPRRQALQAWSNAVKRIGKGTGKYANQHRRAARQHIGACQPAIPAWIMPLYRVAESVPPAGSRFDVVIIDEASQSGPEALALLFIADKIVVVGDAKQISPDPFTRVEDVNRLRRELVADIPANDALDPENSLFDLAVIRYPTRIRLVEHFRCMPEIIQFSNDLCYRSEPLLPLRQFGAGRLEPVVSAIHVPTGHITGRTQKVNRPEAAAVARKVAELARDERYAGKTFGVISLLGERHARVIESELESLMDARERNERSLICGDAYDFQGDERDVMFLSLVAAPSTDQPVRALADPKGRDTRRYNVAMSRAKDQVWLFHSATLNDLSPNDLRFQLLRYCQNPLRRPQTMAGLDVDLLRTQARTANRGLERPPRPFDSWFEVDVFLRIVAAGFTVVPQYDVSGYLIDLAVIGRAGKLAVECDGEFWHGPERWASDAARQRDLERCGWPFARIRESTFYLDPAAALEPLWTELHRHGIADVSASGPHGVAGRVTDDAGDTALFCEERAAVRSPAEADERGEQDAALAPYDAWSPHPVPNPRTASRDAVVTALCEIVVAEGPATWGRIFDLYRLGLGLGRLKGPTRDALETAARIGIRSGRLVEWNEHESEDRGHMLVRVPEADPVRLRQRGPRDLEDVPPSEIAALMRQKKLGVDDEEAAFRQVLASYGLRRLTNSVTDHLRRAKRLLVEVRPEL